MQNRREFLKDVSSAAAGIFFVGCGFSRAAVPPLQTGSAGRRQVVVAGRRVKTVDVHAHCLVSDAWDLVKDYDWGQSLGPVNLATPTGRQLHLAGVQDRLRAMDEQGIDMEVLSINPFWYTAGRGMAAQLITIQNEKLAGLCAAHPDRFAGLSTIALQYPYLAAEQLEDGFKRLGLRGCSIGGSVNGMDLSNPKFNPFWAKAEELGALVFIHPQAQGVAADLQRRLQGNGALANTIGNPLETTVALSHLIFEGTLDRFPGLKICAAHGGGYLPSYIGRSDRCKVRETCGPVMKKMPSEYLEQLYFDSMVFTPEGLRHLVAEAGAGQIVLGTDYPFGWTSEAVDHILNTPGLSDDDKRAMLGETAARLLRIGS
jgi:aminocarboxymuconate-semialdehyde decarboxylase